jgi:hypothetical protein
MINRTSSQIFCNWLIFDEFFIVKFSTRKHRLKGSIKTDEVLLIQRHIVVLPRKPLKSCSGENSVILFYDTTINLPHPAKRIKSFHHLEEFLIELWKHFSKISFHVQWNKTDRIMQFQKIKFRKSGLPSVFLSIELNNSF